jgi:predicted protein tyrosine phosphatase
LGSCRLWWGASITDGPLCYRRPIEAPIHILFLCSRNRWRSPTAEKLFAGAEGLRVRSRGLARTARRRLSDSDLDWADLVLVMDDPLHARLLEHHRTALAATPVHVLDIPDDYRFMDPELVAILQTCVPPLIAAHRGA